ncbi:MAG: DUF948 domain-containing protein [Endomicrobia bacterium]|nr:DUF948 domain-containing protein [Endomicrobiia bacterium]
MTTFIIIAITIFLISFIILVVYCIVTLLQIKKTAKEAELVLQKINKNLENITGVTTEIKKVIASSVPITISIVTTFTTGILKFLKNLFFRR